LTLLEIRSGRRGVNRLNGLRAFDYNKMLSTLPDYLAFKLARRPRRRGKRFAGHARALHQLKRKDL